MAYAAIGTNNYVGANPYLAIIIKRSSNFIAYLFRRIDNFENKSHGFDLAYTSA